MLTEFAVHHITWCVVVFCFVWEAEVLSPGSTILRWTKWPNLEFKNQTPQIWSDSHRCFVALCLLWNNKHKDRFATINASLFPLHYKLICFVFFKCGCEPRKSHHNRYFSEQQSRSFCYQSRSRRVASLGFNENQNQTLMTWNRKVSRLIATVASDSVTQSEAEHGRARRRKHLFEFRIMYES